MTGDFEADLRLDAITPIADGVVSLTLIDPSGAPLPLWQPGAHVDLLLSPVLTRQYSLCSDPGDRSRFTVAVLREPQSRGGSQHIHERLSKGDYLRVRGPRNNFPLVEVERYTFVAGGIGITPLLPMVAAAQAGGRPWRLVYGGRTLAGMAFRKQLEDLYGDKVLLWPQDQRGLIDLPSLLANPEPGHAVYCCGPEPLLAAIEAQCVTWPAGALHLERFAPKDQQTGPDTAFEVELARTGRTVEVPAAKSIVDALADAGVEVATSCREGTCGTCETAVLLGTPDHRDSLLSDDERAESATMMLCVSRSYTKRLVLDL